MNSRKNRETDGQMDRRKSRLKEGRLKRLSIIWHLTDRHTDRQNGTTNRIMNNFYLLFKMVNNEVTWQKIIPYYKVFDWWKKIISASRAAKLTIGFRVIFPGTECWTKNRTENCWIYLKGPLCRVEPCLDLRLLHKLINKNVVKKVLLSIFYNQCVCK